MEEAKEEVRVPTASPVGTPKKNGGKNKDGFVAGQVVESDDYFKFLAEQRAKSKK